MTIFEASEKYNIPVRILQAYECWGLCGEEERLKMLETKRNGMLDEIHFKERQLDRLDYLQFEMKSTNKNKTKRRIVK